MPEGAHESIENVVVGALNSDHIHSPASFPGFGRNAVGAARWLTQ